VTLRTLAPGVLLAALIAALAWLAAPHARRVVPLDATFLALALGLAVGALARRPAAVEPGAQRALKWTLLVGVVLLGAEVDLAFLAGAGARGLALAAALIALTLVAFLLLARVLRVGGDTWALLGAGTGICGLSAVIATGASLRSKEEDIAVAVAGVGLLSAVGLLLYPAIGLALALPPAVYGAWAGMSVHAVANAVAAGFALGDEAGQVATVTKLARVALLAPTLLVLTLAMRHKAEAKGGASALLPPMVWGFLLMVAAVSLLPLPDALVGALKLAAKLFLVLSMAALGYTTRLGQFRRAGPRGIALAVAGWAVLSLAALAGASLVYG